jgi:hypothetical protein
LPVDVYGVSVEDCLHRATGWLFCYAVYSVRCVYRALAV